MCSLVGREAISTPRPRELYTPAETPVEEYAFVAEAEDESPKKQWLKFMQNQADSATDTVAEAAELLDSMSGGKGHAEPAHSLVIPSPERVSIDLSRPPSRPTDPDGVHDSRSGETRRSRVSRHSRRMPSYTGATINNLEAPTIEKNEGEQTFMHEFELGVARPHKVRVPVPARVPDRSID